MTRGSFLACFSRLLWALTLCATAAQAQSGAPGSPFTMGSGHILTSYGAPHMALAGDTDGSGRADFLGLDPQNHAVDFARMTASGKLMGAVRAREHFGGEALTAACGAFSGGRGSDVLGLFTDGSVLVAYHMEPGAHIYSQMVTAATLPKPLIPKAPVLAVTGDFDGDGKPDVLLADANGKLLLLRNTRGNDDTPRFTPLPVEGASLSVRRIAAGDLKGTGRAEIVWLDRTGGVHRAALDLLPTSTARLGSTQSLTTASPDAGLAIGHFRGAKQADVLIGQRLLPGGDPAHPLSVPNLPNAQRAKGDYAWIAADFNGDGKDDLLCAQRTKDPLDGDHVYIYYAHDAHDQETLQFDDTDNDGLPDAWETGAIKPGGLDLKALGCSPRHADVIVEVQRIADVPEAPLHADMDKAIKYFASLPVKNPDGTPGIALHVIYREPIPLDEGKRPWWELAAKYHARNHRGVTHWMVVYNGGGGQSSQMGDDGSCGRFGMPAVFIHEFGHQLGLDHTGRWGPAWCPTYPSLMNYAYNYQRNGRAEDVGFSDGQLASVVLNERHLDEYLPLPIDKLAFLAGPPYHYRMKPAPDGKGTLIDWNWNGIFGEKDIAADINYGYSTTGGERHIVCKTYTSPAVAAYGRGRTAKLLVFYGALPPGTPVPAAEIKANAPSLSADQPGRLCMRVWQGKDPAKDGGNWSEETQLEASGLTGEASAVSDAQATWIAYPTVSGVRLRRITLDAKGAPQSPNAGLVPDSTGAQPTLTRLAGRMVLLLWRDHNTPVGMRWIDLIGTQLKTSDETPLDFTSNAPVGAAEGRDARGQTALWIGLTQDQDSKRPSRWQIRSLNRQSDGALRQTEQFWADGEAGQDRGEGRVTLLMEQDPAFGPEGRWYFLQRGGPHDALNQDYIGMKIADKSVNGGCLTRRYYDEWTNSRCAPGACWFRNDIALSLRWFGDAPAYKNDDLLVGFFGRGIESEPMGDFDDLSEIRNYGLTDSIPNVTE